VAVVGAPALESLCGRVLEAAGAPPRVAAIVAESLVLSNLKGVDSHGVVRIPEYLEAIDAGLTDPAAEPAAEDRGQLVVLDGRRGLGQVAARVATRLAVERALGGGLGLATLARVRHVGRLGEYVERAAGEGCVALAWCNTGPPGGRVVPFGGAGPLLGTNPIAYAVPAPGRPLVADFSTSAVAEGRVRLARQAGARIPEGWIVEAGGGSSTNPSDLYEGGGILPAGGHKGTALALLAEILGGALAGAGCACAGDDPGNGLVLLAIDPGRVRPPSEFGATVGRVLDALRAAPAAEGVERVLAPGDLEAETEARRRAEGIPLPERTWRELLEVGARLGVSPGAETDSERRSNT